MTEYSNDNGGLLQRLSVSAYLLEDYTRDGEGKLTSLLRTLPSIGQDSFQYDSVGHLQSIDNGNMLTDYLYDGNNLRVVKQGYNATIHYHYDNQGRLLAESASDGTLHRAVVWFGGTPIALLDIEQTDPTIYTCSATESMSGATGPDVTIDTAAHSITIHTGDYAGIYAISAADWIEYDAWISFKWSNASFRFEGGFYPDLTRPWRSGGLVFYHYDTEGNPQIADIYKLWKESESGGSTEATPYHLHPNQIGAPVLLTDANGAAVWAAEYAPFGQATLNDDVDGDGNKVTCNLRFPGQYFDAESGLHYNWHQLFPVI